MRGGKKMGSYGGTPGLSRGEGKNRGTDGKDSPETFKVSPNVKVVAASGSQAPNQKSEAHYRAVLHKAINKTGQESD